MKSKKLLALSIVTSLLSTSHLQAQERPRLMVFIAIDQMRADYLERFGSVFEGGFIRLKESGLRFSDTYHAHAMTETAPGHATLVSGVNPSRTGILANEWWDRSRQSRMYAADDSASVILGDSLASGRSPSTLLRSTLSDWLKASSPESKVVSLAVKDRVSVMLGGQRPDHAYWYDTRSGRYVTSSYYASDYPDWLVARNDEISAPEYVARSWERARPEEAYTASRVDSFPAEYDGIHTMFPHVIDPADTLRSPYLEWIHTPYADETTLSLARELVIREGLGEDEVVDLLLLGMSAGDYIGHRYGPFSQEVEDYYIQLDEMLGAFFAFLDEQVGRDRYALMLTADHGVVRMPEYSAELGEPGRRVSTDDLRDQLLAGLTEGIYEFEVFARPAPIMMYPLGLVLRFQGDTVTEDQLRGVRKAVANRLRESDVIADAFTYDELLDETVDRGLIATYRKSFHPDRAADVVIQYRENNTFPASLVANHGSPYAYDTHVPLIVLAPGLDAGQVARRVWTVDVAPSLAAMLGIDAPDDLDGTVITELEAWRERVGRD